MELSFICQKDDKIVKAKLGDLDQIKFVVDMFSCEGVLINNDEIPLDIDSKMFKEILTYCQYHTSNKKIVEKVNEKDPLEVDKWDKEFIEKFMDVKTAHKELLELYLYADYLDIPDMRELIAKSIVNMMNSANTPDEFRRNLGI